MTGLAAWGRPSVWRVPVVSLVAAAIWLVSVPVAVWLGIKMNGVDPDKVGQAGPDVFDIASSEIRLMVVLSSTVIFSVALALVLIAARRSQSAAPTSVLERVGTIVLWIATGLMCVVTLPFFLAYVLAPSFGA